MIVLAGDVGGTNARLALAELDGRSVRIASQDRYHSADYPGLGPIVNRFIQETGTRPDRACFGIACPVVGEDCTAPNLPWTINARRLADEIGIDRTGIINDFVAVGYAVEVLGPLDLVTLQEGTPVAQGPIALIGAGTGLGQAFLIWQGDHYRVLASEGGHGDFAPIGAVQIGMLQALTTQFGRVSWERLLSGPGIANIYRCLLAAGVAPEQPAVRAELDAEDDGTVIVRHALDASDPLSLRAVETFWEVLGAQTGNLALTAVATGGVYIAGGIAPRLVNRLDRERFLAAFRNKGRLSPLLGKIPVHVIMNPSVGLIGAAAVAGRIG
ncbi:MAG TPA: glucokinase [Gemmatimonadales bacterium]|nr:glucokinase [Gemmatimonadales bacterium]